MPRRPLLPGRTFAGLELSHPVNKGLVEEFVCAPTRFGGAATLGLKANTKGTFNGGAKWQLTGRPGGYGQWSFPGASTANISVGSALLTALVGKPFTISCWFNPTNVTGYQCLFGGGASSSQRQLNAYLGGAANHLFFGYGDAGGGEFTALTDSWVVGAWQCLGITSDLTNAGTLVYRNGRNIGNGSGLSLFGAGIVPTTWYIGGSPVTDSTLSYAGLEDQVQIYNRVLSPAEMSALYDQARRGNPDRWRWLSRAAWLLPTGGGGNSLTRTASDAPSTADAAARVFTGTRTASDGPTTADAVVRTLMLFRTAADAPTTADAAARVFVGHRTASDAPATADAGAASKTFIRTASDSPATIDSASAMRTYLRTVMDAPATLDLAARAFTGFRTATDHPLTADAAFATVIGPQQPPSEIIYLTWASGTPILASWSPGNPIMLSWQA